MSVATLVLIALLLLVASTVTLIIRGIAAGQGREAEFRHQRQVNQERRAQETSTEADDWN